MKIPISGNIPRSYGPPPLQKGAIGGFLGVGPDPLRLISCAVLYRVARELLRGKSSHSALLRVLDRMESSRTNADTIVMPQANQSPKCT